MIAEQKRPRSVLFALILAAALFAASCGGGPQTPPQTTAANTNTGGLTSIEASNLAWPKAEQVFGDAVLWRLVPVKDKNSTVMSLDPNWSSNDRSAAWFVWYADPASENWLMISISGKSIDKTDIGTRSFSVLTMDSKWPRQQTAVSMKDAAAAAVKQGASLDAVTWVEYSCDYGLGEVRRTPVWVFACTETLGNGGTLNYRMIVNAMTGTVAGCFNERNEEMAIPIDKDALTQTRAASHEADLRQFFKFITDGDHISAVRQLAYQASPNEAMNQMWLANFQSLKSLKVISVEPAELESWTETWERYKVVLEVTTDEPPEKYGWDEGRNTRWVTLIPQGGGGWKVEALATNP